MMWSDEEIWLRNLSLPIRDIMRFVLVYHGPLSASGNKSAGKHSEVLAIREAFSKQLAVLWDTHTALQHVKEEAWAEPRGGSPRWERPAGHGVGFGGNVLATPREVAREAPELGLVYLAGEIPVGVKKYTPLIRKSLHLACELEILFLRQDDPGALITQGGDLDNRIKTLLDALRVPTEAEQGMKMPANDHLFCLLESDTLVSALDVNTDRLLFAQTDKPNEVYLVVDVSVRVLEVNRANVCLL